MNLVYKWYAPNALAIFACVRWISGLNDERLDIAMERAVVVVVRRAQSQKVLKIGRDEFGTTLTSTPSFLAYKRVLKISGLI